MKPRIQFFFIIGLVILVLGIAWYTFPGRKQEPAQIFSATIRRDCAPWDGAAFSVSIPMEDGKTVEVSIWKSPDIKLPVRYSFPDSTANIGNASFRLGDENPQQLSGIVWFQHVEEGKPVEGRFSLRSERGELIEGRFSAEWGNLVAFCG